MTTKVTRESLAENIGRLESYGDLSLNEEYQLKAYRMLSERLEMESAINAVLKEPTPKAGDKLVELMTRKRRLTVVK